MKKKLSVHQETISILSQQKEAQIKLYKTRKDKELDKVIALENKVKVLDNIVYKTGQSVQTMNMLNNKCQMSFAKPEFLKRAQRVNLRLYDIGCYNDNLALMLAFESDEDKAIAISELKKLIAKLKGKSMHIKFEKSSVIRQPNAFKSQRPSILGKPTIFSDSLKGKDFSKSKSVTQNNVSNDFSKPVTTQILPSIKKSILKHTKVLASGMYKLHTKPTQTRTFQLPNDSRKTNKRVSFSTGVIPTTSVSRPNLKSSPMEDRVLLNNSQGKKPKVEDHHRNVKFFKNKMSVTACNDSLNVKTSNVTFVCATCGKCMLNDKHDMCVLKSVAKPLRKTVASESNQKPRNSTRKIYERISVPLCQILHCLLIVLQLIEIVLFIVDSGCSKHMMGNLKLLINFMEKFLGTVKFRNDQIALILGYGDLVQGAVTIKRVYYVEGLNHNLFSVGQFCNADLEVSFRKSTCYIRDLKGNDLLTCSRGTDLYSISLQDTTSHNLICLMAKVTSSQAWLWHRRLSHLNFDTINLLSNNDIVIGLPKLKFVKDHLCSSFELGKDKRKSFQTKATLSSKRRLQLLHMDLCGPMLARTPKQNGVVERRNCTLVEAARTMLSAAKVSLFFWAEVIATTCFTQNHSLVIPRLEKKPYQIINDWKRSFKFFYLFGSLCYIVGDGDNLDKMKEKGDACSFVGYSTQSRAYRVYNKRTRVIVETIHVNFDELPQMASDHVSRIVKSSNELDLLFSLMFDELLNGSSQVVSKSFTVTVADALNHRQQYVNPLNTQSTPEPTCQVPTQAIIVTSTEDINQAKTIKEYSQVENDEFINIFSTPVQERGEKSSRHVDLSNMHTFYQHHPSEHRWTKDHSLEKVIGNPSQSVRTRRQLESDGEMCMFALTVSQTEPKNIKEAMADSAWIESIHEELHQFD
nr:integrase, catalytic region, zinc finger, CCHC-type, peptidase aspartic, catalytic [Tanacetum cinerariifolium]